LLRDTGDRHKEANSLVRLGDTHLAAGDSDAARTAWRRAVQLLAEMGHQTPKALLSRLKSHGRGA
jgi:predicted negative regulator of RcsB-dependent stress response